MKQLLRNRHLLSLTGNGVMSVLNGLTYALLFRVLTPADMGNWVFFQFAFLLLDTFRTGLLQTALIKFYAGAGERRQRALAGAAWYIGLGVTGLFVVLDALAWPARPLLPDAGVQVLLRWAGLALAVTLPFNVAVWVLQAEQRFDRILYVRLLNQGSFILFVGLLYLLHGLTLLGVVQAFVLSSLLTSVATTALGWGRLRALPYRTADTVRELFHFGKYSFGTFLCANLLRSSDSFIVKFMLGPAALAVYNLPLRLLELVEIPLRSGLATAMPSMSAAVNHGNKTEVSRLLTRYVGFLTVLFVPLVLGVLLFADVAVGLVGGGKYVGTEAGTLYRIVMVCSLLFPLERFLGVALDLIGRPQLNLVKVLLALAVNVVADVVCIHFTHSVYGAAGASIFTLLASTVYGYVVLRRFLPVSFRDLPELAAAELRTRLDGLLRRWRPARV